MTTYEEARRLIKKVNDQTLLLMMAIVIGAFSDRKANPKEIDFFNRSTKGTLKRLIRDLRLVQSNFPEYNDDMEKAICFIRCDVLKKGTV